MNPHDAAHALAGALKKSPEFSAFKEARDKLKEDKVAEGILNDLREIQLELQELHLEGKDISGESDERYKKLSDAASFNLTVKAYVEAEYRFAILMMDIQKIIGDAVDVGDE